MKQGKKHCYYWTEHWRNVMTEGYRGLMSNWKKPKIPSFQYSTIPLLLVVKAIVPILSSLFLL